MKYTSTAHSYHVDAIKQKNGDAAQINAITIAIYFAVNTITIATVTASH